MSLRPRYSLLTLLVLTALVAGGVKLWYGPHHVVERNVEGEEMEYSYFLDWRGQRIVDGPYVERYYNLYLGNEKRTLQGLAIYYYRGGIRLPWAYTAFSSPDENASGEKLAELKLPTEPIENVPLTKMERDVFHQTIRRERVKLHNGPGISISEFQEMLGLE